MKNMVQILSFALLCTSGQGVFAAETSPSTSNIAKTKEFLTSNAYNNVAANHLVINDNTSDGTPKFRRYVTSAQARRFQVRLASLKLNTQAAGKNKEVDDAIEFDQANSPRREAFIKRGKDKFSNLSSAYSSISYIQSCNSIRQQAAAPASTLTTQQALEYATNEIATHKAACSYDKLAGHTTSALNMYLVDGTATTLNEDQAWQEVMRADALDLINLQPINPNEPLSPGLRDYIEAGKQQFDLLEKASNYTKGQAVAKQQRSTFPGAVWYGLTNWLVGSKGNLAQVKSLDFNDKLGTLAAADLAYQRSQPNESKRPEQKD